MNLENSNINFLLEGDSLSDFKKLNTIFSINEIIKAILNHTGFEAKTRNYYSRYYNIPIHLIKANGLISRMAYNFYTGRIETYHENL